jgi:hypothetical protein
VYWRGNTADQIKMWTSLGEIKFTFIIPIVFF